MHKDRTDRIVRRVATVVLATFAAAVAFASTAAASSPAQAEGAVGVDHSVVVALTSLTAPSSASLIPDDGDYKDANYLPVNRWMGASSTFHSRLDTSIFNPGAVLDAANRSAVTSSFMSFGNTMWSAATWMVESATRFDIVDSAVGGIVDQAAGSFGTTITKNPAIWVALLVVLGVTLLWKMANSRASGASAARELIRAAATIAVTVVMISGAMNTTYNEKTNTVTYGKMSPGWIVSSLNSAISSVAGTVTVGLVNDISTPASEQGRKDSYSCDAYVRALEASYMESAATTSEASTSVALNGMWKLTGLEAWITNQFGATTDGHSVYCRLLEVDSGVTPIDQIRVQGKACVIVQGPSSAMRCTENTGAAQTSLAFASAGVDDGSTEAVDIALVGWAVCTPTTVLGATDKWKVRSMWSGYKVDQQGDLKKACNAWWAGGSGATDTSQVGVGPLTITFNKAEVDFLNVGPNPGDVTAAVPGSSANDAEVRQYLWSLHGNSAAGSGGNAAAMTYVMSAATNLVAFGMASALIMVAKIMSVVFMLLLFVVLLFSLFPGGADDRIVSKFLRQFLGMTFIAFGYSLVLSMLVLISSVIIKLVATQFGAGTLPTMIFSGMAPLIAWFTIAYIFKTVFKAPNPMSLRGGLAYAGAAGAVGGAAAGAVQNLGRRATNDAAQAAKSKALQSVGISGGKSAGRRGGAPSADKGGMSKALATEVPEGSTQAELNAARSHDLKLKQAEADGIEQQALAQGQAVRSGRAAAREAAGERTGIFAAQGDRIAGAYATAKARKEAGRPAASGMGRVLAGSAVALGNATAKPRAHLTSVAGAVATGDRETIRAAASAAAADGVRGAGNLGSRAVSATANGVAFAAQHPLKATGRVVTGAAIAAMAVTPGGLPFAAGTAAAAKVVSDRRKTSAPPSVDDNHRVLDQYRRHQEAEQAKREAQQGVQTSGQEGPGGMSGSHQGSAGPE